MTADTQSVMRGLRPLSSLSQPREMIRQFTPNWFAATCRPVRSMATTDPVPNPRRR